MAAPKVHAVPTLALLVLAVIFYTPLMLYSKNLLISLLILFLGVLMDFADHLSVRRIKKILRGEKGPVPGWVNWMHTWQAAVGVIILSVLIGNLLPFLSYAIHILIDGGDKSNLNHPKVAPLPIFLGHYYPEWAKYETKMNI